MRVETAHLSLIPYSPDHLLALIEGYERFEECFGMKAADAVDKAFKRCNEIFAKVVL